MSIATYSKYGFAAQRIGNLPKTGGFSYKSFDKGINVFAHHNEIKENEFYEGVNIMITGKGSIQMPRYGSALLIKKIGATKCNGAGIFKDKTTSPPLETPLFMFDGRLYKYVNNSLVEIDSSKTWDPNEKMQGVMFQDWFYFCNGKDSLSKTNLTSVVQFVEISKPSSISVSYTGSGNEYIYKYAMTVVTDYGESDPVESGDFYGAKILDASNYFTISCPRKTESQVIGYNIYRSVNGSRLQFLTFVAQPASGDPSFKDIGYQTSPQYEAPYYNTTGGVKGKFLATFSDTLFVAGVENYPDILFFTGAGESYESFSPDTGGGWVRISYGDGQRITAIKNFDTYLLVIKENKVFRFNFEANGAMMLQIAEALYGSPYPYTVDKFEKDLIMLSSDNRIRTLGYEPNLLNVIRTNDISNRIQPIIENNLDLSNPDKVHGVYWKQKYILCDGNNAIAYDRQYIGYHGLWTNFKFSNFLTWNKEGREYLLGIKDTGEILNLLVEGVYDDNGENIIASFRPKTIDGKEDTLVKFFRYYKVKLKDFNGSFKLQTYIDGITLEDERTITISSTGGIATIVFGDRPFGDASSLEIEMAEALGTTKILTKEIYKEAYYFHPRFEIVGNANNHIVIQSIMGVYDYEDVDYHKQEEIIAVET